VRLEQLADLGGAAAGPSAEAVVTASVAGSVGAVQSVTASLPLALQPGRLYRLSVRCAQGVTPWQCGSAFSLVDAAAAPDSALKFNFERVEGAPDASDALALTAASAGAQAGGFADLGLPRVPAFALLGASRVLAAGVPQLPTYNPAQLYRPSQCYYGGCGGPSQGVPWCEWKKRVVFDSNDALACSGACAFVPPFCAAGILDSALPGGIAALASAAASGAAASAASSSSAPPSAAATCAEPEVPLDLRLLPAGFAGSTYASDVVVASRASCALLLAKRSALQCSTLDGMSVQLDGATFVFVGTAADLKIAPAVAPPCGA
jgi:hypothetical protein